MWVEYLRPRGDIRNYPENHTRSQALLILLAKSLAPPLIYCHSPQGTRRTAREGSWDVIQLFDKLDFSAGAMRFGRGFYILSPWGREDEGGYVGKCGGEGRGMGYSWCSGNNMYVNATSACCHLFFNKSFHQSANPNDPSLFERHTAVQWMVLLATIASCRLVPMEWYLSLPAFSFPSSRGGDVTRLITSSILPRNGFSEIDRTP